MKAICIPVRMLLLVAVSLSQPCRAEWNHHVTALMARDDNVTLGHQARDILADTYVGVSYAPSYQWFTGSGIRLEVQPGIGYRRHHEYSGLSALRGSIDVVASSKLGIGRLMPSVRGGATFGIEDSKDRYRDGTDYRVFLDFKKPFSETLDATVFLEYGARKKQEKATPSAFAVSRGLSSEVFDTEALTGGISLDYYLTERWLLMFAYQRMVGDVTSVTRPDFTVLANSTALLADAVFGPGWIAYRMDAVAASYSFGASYELNRHTALNVTFEKRDAASPGGLSYRNDIISAELSHVF